MQLKDTSKIYPCWRTYKEGEKLPVMTFQNGNTIDLSSPEVADMLSQVAETDMLMFYEHLYYGRYQQCSGQTNYLFGSNFSVHKNEDGTVLVFGNGCSFE